jgi:TatD DNase family protein
MLVDSHCHLDFADFDAERDELVERAHASGVRQMVTISTRVRKLERLLALTERYPSVFCSVGTHPNNADEELDVTADELVQLAEATPRSWQSERPGSITSTTRRNPRTRRPVSAPHRGGAAHTAAAGDPQPQRRRRHGGDPDRGNGEGGLPLHSALLLVGPGAGRHRRGAGRLCSFSGILTFRSRPSFAKSPQTVPMDRLLVETDAPYLAPKRWRGKRNEPSYVVNTAEVLAEVKGVSYEEIARITTENAFRCYSKMPRL